jgi:hypothetical protein
MDDEDSSSSCFAILHNSQQITEQDHDCHFADGWHVD